jgi:Glucan phosphorylase
MNAPFTYASPTLTVDALKHSIAYKLMFTIGKDPSIANQHEWLNAALLAVRDRMVNVGCAPAVRSCRRMCVRFTTCRWNS